MESILSKLFLDYWFFLIFTKLLRKQFWIYVYNNLLCGLVTWFICTFYSQLRTSLWGQLNLYVLVWIII